MIGERVRLVREACHLTQEELAAATSVPLGTLSGIEAGQVLTPSEDIIERIAAVTLYPPRFFYLGPLPDLPDGHYRKLKRGTKRDTKQVRAHVRHYVEIIQRSEEVLQLPSVTLRATADEPSLEAIENMAATTREQLGVGQLDPIPNLVRATERAGVIVVRLPLDMRDHDGFSSWPDYGMGGRPIIALTANHPGDRDRFNVGHEVGHLVLHTRRPETDPKKAEMEANRFSGALLLPRERAVEAMRPPITLRVLMKVKETFGTSIAMNAQRARDLGLVTEDQFVSFRKQLSARRWRIHEPVNVPVEAPLLISKLVKKLGGEGPTIQRAERLTLPPYSYRTLAG